MTTGPVEQALQQSLWRVSQGMVFGADRDFLSTLTLGQIIKGRVLRHYEGGRYGVEFGGQERVVDSTIALRSGDVIHGRVVGLDDRVHLQRVAVEPAPERAAERVPAEAAAAARPGDAIEQLFREHRAVLSPAEHATLRTLGRQLGDAGLAASAALVLRKLGLPMDAGLVRAVAGALSDRGRPAPAVAAGDAARLAAEATHRVADNHATVRLLAEALEQLRVPERAGGSERAEPGPAPGAGLPTAGDAGPGVAADGGAGGRGQSDPFLNAWLLGRRVLNSQDEGSVAHRYCTLPVWLGGRLVEIDLALFAQTPAEPGPDGLRHRRIVLSLELEGLGRIEAVVTVANDRVRVAFETAREEATQLLALWMGSLKADLSAFGWRLDELSYGTRYAEALDGPAEAVVTHYIRRDSVSRLM